MKIELRKKEQIEKDAGKHIDKDVGKRAGKFKPGKPRTLQKGKVPTPVDVLLKNMNPT